jgi:PAS domain S-box-containing protein
MTNSTNTSSLSFWNRLADLLTRPAREITSPDTQRQARFLAVVNLTGTFFVFVRMSVSLRSGSYLTDPSFGIYPIIAVLVAIGYVLGRTRFLTASTMVLSIALAIPSYGTILLRENQTPINTLDTLLWVLIAFFVGAYLLPWGAGLVWMGANLIALAALPLLTSKVIFDNIASLLYTVLVLTAVTAIVTRYRDLIEDDRRKALIDANWQLQEFNANLETRVQERAQELTQTQDRTRALLRDLDEATRIARLANYELDVANQTLTLSDRFFELLGTTAAAEGGYHQPIPHVIQKFLHPDDAARMAQDVLGLSNNAAPDTGEIEYRMRHANGAVRYFALRYTVERDAFHQIAKLKGAAQDITDQKLVEATLREREDDLTVMLESSPEAIGVVNTRTGLFEGTNAAAEKLYGLKRADLVKVGPAQISPERQPNGRLSSEMAMEKIGLALSGTPVTFEWRHINAAGQEFPCEVRLVGLTGERSHLVRFSVIDISQRKAIEELTAKRAVELETVTELATAIATMTDAQAMLQTVVDEVKHRFNLYHAHIYLLNETGDTLQLTAGAGDAGRQMVSSKRAIALNAEQSLVARAARTKRGVVINDVAQEPGFLPNPLLPDTQAELAVPMLLGNSVLGVLDVQANRAGTFTNEDVRVQTILASQIATALQNARLLAQSEKARHELSQLTRRLTREGWENYLTTSATDKVGYFYNEAELRPLTDAKADLPLNGHSITRPITVHGETLGQLAVDEAEKEPGEIAAVLDAVAQALSTHIDNLRLAEQTQNALAQTETLYTLTAQLNSASSIDDAIRLVGIARNATSATFLSIETNQQNRPEWLTLTHSWSQAQSGSTVPLNTRFPVEMFPSAHLWIDDPDTPMLYGDIKTDPRLDSTTRDLHLQSNVRASVQIVLRIGDQWVGLLTLTWLDPQHFTPADTQLYRALAAQVAVVVNNRLLFEQTQKRAEREATINQIAQKIQSTGSVEQAIQTTIEELGRTLQAKRASVKLASS